jgi:hypothetical protein
LEEKQDLITGLSQINLFVGSNNSGKSRFLRSLVSADKLRFRSRNHHDEYSECARFLKKEFLQIGPPNTSVSPFEELAAGLPDYELTDEGSENHNAIRSLVSRAANVKGNDFSVSTHWVSFPDSSQLVRKIQTTGKAAAEILAKVREPGPQKFEFKRIYLPTLRGLRSVVAENLDVYTNRTVKDYFNEKSPSYIFSGLGLYQELQDLLLGDRGQRESVRKFEKYLSESIFSGQSVSLMPRKNSDVIWVRIGNEPERPIHLLGDGVQQLVILTFPLFRNQNAPTLVFIEEPELFLHPGMQRSFIKALRLFDNYQYFIATHSNHLLDLTIEFDDISIFMVRKQKADTTTDEHQPSCEIEPASTHDHRLHEALGTRTSSVFLSNCTIWVEGITDRRYLAHFLELYSQHIVAEAGDSTAGVFPPRQDFHFSFVEYSGGNITHWSFLERTPDPIEVTRLCARLMLVVDKDGAAWKAKRHEELERALGENLVLLDCREIENMLSADVLTAVLVSYGEDPSNIKKLDQNAYASKPLGKVLEGKITSFTRQGGYAEESGTLKNKVDFCSRALNHMKVFSELSPNAQDITTRIYNFIKSQNC